MRTLKRLIVSMNGQFESMVNQMENHEAIANSIIKEVHDSASNAKVQLRKVRSDLAATRTRMSVVEAEVDQWVDRARRVNEEDESRALECIRRVRSKKAELEALTKQEKLTAELEIQLTRDLEKVEQKLLDLRNKKRALSSRQSTMQALSMASDDNSHLMNEIDDIFGRWESKVSSYELAAGEGQFEVDELSACFEKEESEKSLKKELNDILKHGVNQNE